MSNRELKNQLKNLKGLEAAGRPQEGWVLSSREILLSQINSSKTVYEPVRVSGFYWTYFGQVLTQRVLRPVAAFLVVLALGVGYTTAISVTDASLPGDLLYPVKTATEKMQLALTFSDGKKVELQMDFASRHVGELKDVLSRNEDSQAKAKNLSVAVKKISNDVLAVKDGLNRISAASVSQKEIIDLAKNVDTQTLAVGQELSRTKIALPEDVKKDVSKEIDRAISSVDETGTHALSVMVKEFKAGAGQEISDAEMTSRVADRIKSIEDNIQITATQVSVQAATSTTGSNSGVASTTTAGTNSSSYSIELNLTNSTSSRLILESPKQVQQVIDEAKGLLSQKDFGLVIEKIKESNSLVSGVLENTEEVAGSVKGELEVSTSTPVVNTSTDSIQN